jgi:YegS/Rv2252/BmrU family lipid kinase
MRPRSDWFVVVNPASGSGRSLRSWRALEAALGVEGLTFEAVVTRHAGDGEDAATAAVRRGFRRLLAVGGDGTLHEVLNGALAVPGVDSRELVLAVAPFGTGNDWARGRGVPREALALARCLTAGRTARCDVGIIEFTGTPAAPHRHFINVAGAGIDAEVLAALPRGPARRSAYLLGVLRALWSFRPPEFTLHADAREERGARLVALAANGAYCGNGMRLAPGAVADDGLLDIVTVEPLPLLAALRRLPRLFDGRLAGERWVRSSRTACLEMRANPAATIEADGQIVGTTPARLRVLPGAIQVLDCAPPA